MNKKRISLILPGLLLLLSGAPGFGQTTGKYFEIAKNLEIFANAYKEVNHGYVDQLDPGQVMRRGMDAMLEGLDPFTNYISETDIEGFRIQTDGRYNGVGAQGKKIGDYVVITEIYEDSPAHRAELKVGDAITSVDGQNAKGKTETQVMDFLRGFPGTEANLVVRRPGDSRDLKITLKREEVNIPNVPHSGMVSGDVGYINLTTFTQNAGENISSALQKLKSNPKLKGVILDLRGNGGGLLNEAVNIINIFVPKGEAVVTTHGKVIEWDNVFRTQNQPVDTELPVVVLIDKGSASASEVVSGALQDLDRAVLMGQRSYGKGLVQNTKDLGYNAKIKLTTAKYYIPSGRCIQSTRYKDGVPVDIPESERAQFKTRNGRVVTDGGGVKPDVLLPYDSASGVVKALLEQNIIFDYVTDWALKSNNNVDSIELFSYAAWDEFTRFVQSKNFDYESASEKKLKELREIAAKENFSLGADIQALETKVKAEKKGELAKHKTRIIREIEQDIVGRYHYQSGKVRKSLKNDPEVEAAVQLINDPAKYKAILAGK